jgi:hypothetical protein
MSVSFAALWLAALPAKTADRRQYRQIFALSFAAWRMAGLPGSGLEAARDHTARERAEPKSVNFENHASALSRAALCSSALRQVLRSRLKITATA